MRGFVVQALYQEMLRLPDQEREWETRIAPSNLGREKAISLSLEDVSGGVLRDSSRETYSWKELLRDFLRGDALSPFLRQGVAYWESRPRDIFVWKERGRYYVLSGAEEVVVAYFYAMFLRRRPVLDWVVLMEIELTPTPFPWEELCLPSNHPGQYLSMGVTKLDSLRHEGCCRGR